MRGVSLDARTFSNEKRSECPYTPNRTGYFVLPEASMPGGRISFALNSENNEIDQGSTIIRTQRHNSPNPSTSMVERMTSAPLKLPCFDDSCGLFSRTRIAATIVEAENRPLQFTFAMLTVTFCTANLLPGDVGAFVAEKVEPTLGRKFREVIGLSFRAC